MSVGTLILHTWAAWLVIALAFVGGVGVGAACVLGYSRHQLLGHVGRLMDLLDAMQGDADRLHALAIEHRGDPETRT